MAGLSRIETRNREKVMPLPNESSIQINVTTNNKLITANPELIFHRRGNRRHNFQSRANMNFTNTID